MFSVFKLLRLAPFAFAMTLALPAQAQDLDDWLGDVADDGTPVSMFLWTPEQSFAAASGPFREGGREISIRDPFAIASVSKVYVAIALIRLAEQGRLNLDAPARQWLPKHLVVNLNGLDKVTTRQLLAMRSGLPEYYTGDYQASATSDSALGELEVVFGESPSFRPGQRFDYSNTNYLVAQIILENLTGQSYGQALDQLVFRPAGLNATEVYGYGIGPRSFVQGQDEEFSSYQDFLRYYAGKGYADGGITATARDVAKLYKALFIDRSLLSNWGLEQLIADAEGDDYGLGIEVERIRGLGRVLGHSGGDTGYATDVRYRVNPPAIAVILVGESDGASDLTYEMLEEY